SGYSTTGGPDGRPYLTLGDGRSITRVVGASVSKWAHVLMRPVDFSGSDTNRRFLQFRENATIHLTIRPNSDGALEVLRGAGTGTSLHTTSAGLLSLEQWYHVGVGVTVHDTTGTVRVLLNGIEVIALSGL